MTLLSFLFPDRLRQDDVVRRRLPLLVLRRRQDFEFAAETSAPQIGLVAAAEVVVTTKQPQVVLVVGGRQVVDAGEALPQMLLVHLARRGSR